MSTSAQRIHSKGRLAVLPSMFYFTEKVRIDNKGELDEQAETAHRNILRCTRAIHCPSDNTWASDDPLCLLGCDAFVSSISDQWFEQHYLNIIQPYGLSCCAFPPEYANLKHKCRNI